MDQQICSYCGCPFNGGNYPSCSIVGAENEFVHDPNLFPYDNTPDFMTNHHSTMSRHTRASYVAMILTMIMIVHHGSCLSMSRNRATIKTLSIVITTSPLVLPIKDLEDSLIMRNKELSTIPKKESDEVIKSSVEDFVPIPSESKDTSGSDSECDLPSYDDFSPFNVPKGKSVTFFNPLFDSNDDFTSSDDESLSDEDVPEDNVLEDIESKDSYDFNLDDPALLVTPLFDSNEDEYFNSGGDVDEINAFVIPLDFKDGYYDLKGEVLYLESFVSDDTIPNLPFEVFLGHDLRSLSFDWFKIRGGDPRVQRDGMGGCQRSRVWIEAEDDPPHVLEPSADCYK
uniref:Uncharacterized protein n=1 Tax=Tanacetum cinerariifolium TaxID=118510 RepID=A0A6L2MW97_TANCI|nr:hypothetical protein [Tanacetum cinerariifolium]